MIIEFIILFKVSIFSTQSIDFPMAVILNRGFQGCASIQIQEMMWDESRGRYELTFVDIPKDNVDNIRANRANARTNENRSREDHAPSHRRPVQIATCEWLL